MVADSLGLLVAHAKLKVVEERLVAELHDGFFEALAGDEYAIVGALSFADRGRRAVDYVPCEVREAANDASLVAPRHVVAVEVEVAHDGDIVRVVLVTAFVVVAFLCGHAASVLVDDVAQLEALVDHLGRSYMYIDEAEAVHGQLRIGHLDIYNVRRTIVDRLDVVVHVLVLDVDGSHATIQASRGAIEDGILLLVGAQAEARTQLERVDDALCAHEGVQVLEHARSGVRGARGRVLDLLHEYDVVLGEDATRHLDELGSGDLGLAEALYVERADLEVGRDVIGQRLRVAHPRTAQDSKEQTDRQNHIHIYAAAAATLRRAVHLTMRSFCSVCF